MSDAKGSSTKGSSTKGSSEGSSDEAIGRPEEWREGRYQQTNKPVDQSVNNPSQTNDEPHDTVGTQTPPNNTTGLDTKKTPDPRERPVTREDYEQLKPPP
jgi:hypothetical protein